jgi:deoxyribodipyrimidine photo-lyase
MTKLPPAILWLRRDLRLTDNPALNAALAHGGPVLPLYIDAPESEAPWAPGGASRWWLHHSLAALDQALRQRGTSLLIARGQPLQVLRALCRETGADAVFWNRQYEPAAIARDTEIKTALQEDGIEVHSSNGTLWREPWQIRTGGNEPYRVFTPFWRNLAAQLPEPRVSAAPERMAAPERVPRSLQLKDLDLLPSLGWAGEFPAHWQPGEAGALELLAGFVETDLGAYRSQRDLPAVDASSRLSAHLHFGELSPQQVQAATRRGAGDAEPYLRQLGWREFAHHLLYHYPHTAQQPLNPKFAAFPWRHVADYGDDLRAWQRGRTGIPIVDAGMRQLWRSGWMHNRVRMLVASLLTKNLLIPWQEGARWFWDTLLDASLANNTMGWQWVAGCGADAAPYFRIFNPVLQSQKFDAHGVYIRRWIPELARLPDDALHAPWLAKPAVLAQAGVRLGHHYPLPIVDLAASRERALAAYAQIKAG